MTTEFECQCHTGYFKFVGHRKQKMYSFIGSDKTHARRALDISSALLIARGRDPNTGKSGAFGLAKSNKTKSTICILISRSMSPVPSRGHIGQHTPVSHPVLRRCRPVDLSRQGRSLQPLRLLNSGATKPRPGLGCSCKSDLQLHPSPGRGLVATELSRRSVLCVLCVYGA